MANDNGHVQGAVALPADDILHVAWKFVLCIGLVGLSLASACLLRVANTMP